MEPGSRWFGGWFIVQLESYLLVQAAWPWNSPWSLGLSLCPMYPGKGQPWGKVFVPQEPSLVTCPPRCDKHLLGLMYTLCFDLGGEWFCPGSLGWALSFLRASVSSSLGCGCRWGAGREALSWLCCEVNRVMDVNAL